MMNRYAEGMDYGDHCDAPVPEITQLYAWYYNLLRMWATR
jgi:predicted 2-oxoglutarate/Fe(II)-dependent dioxygenase YbiX